MDTLTHAFAPAAILRLARRPAREQFAVAVAAASPDLDALWAWLSHIDERAYPLVHRGFSHTIWAAPLIALGAWWILVALGKRPRFHRLAAAGWDRGTLLALVLGAWSHLVLDIMTITGVPLLWPFSSVRVGLNWFFFSVPYLLPVSLVGLVQMARGRASVRWVAGCLAVLLLLLSVAGGVRLASYPHGVAPGSVVVPGPLEWQWFVTTPTADGVHAQEFAFDRVRQDASYADHNRTAAAAAIEACQRRPGYVPWKWDLWGLAVVNATRRSDGGWSIRFEDSAVRLSDSVGTFHLRSPARAEAGQTRDARCEVDADGHATITRARGWVGS